MSCNVAALPFQAHDYYGTWSIDVEKDYDFPYTYISQRTKLLYQKNILSGTFYFD